MAERKKRDVQSSSWCGFQVTLREGEPKVTGSYQVTVSSEDAVDGCFFWLFCLVTFFFHEQIGWTEGVSQVWMPQVDEFATLDLILEWHWADSLPRMAKPSHSTHHACALRRGGTEERVFDSWRFCRFQFPATLENLGQEDVWRPFASIPYVQVHLVGRNNVDVAHAVVARLKVGPLVAAVVAVSHTPWTPGAWGVCDQGWRWKAGRGDERWWNIVTLHGTNISPIKDFKGIREDDFLPP